MAYSGCDLPRIKGEVNSADVDSGWFLPFYLTVYCNIGQDSDLSFSFLRSKT